MDFGLECWMKMVRVKKGSQREKLLQFGADVCKVTSPAQELPRDVFDVSQVPYRTVRSFTNYENKIAALKDQAVLAGADQMVGSNSIPKQINQKRKNQVGLVTNTIKKDYLDPSDVLQLLDEGRGVFLRPDPSNVFPEDIDDSKLDDAGSYGWRNFMNSAAPVIIPVAGAATFFLTAGDADAFESANPSSVQAKYVNSQIEKGMIPLTIVSSNNPKYVMSKHEPIRANLPADTKGRFTNMVQKWVYNKSHMANLSDDQIWEITRDYMRDHHGVDINDYLKSDGQHIKEGSVLRAPCYNQFVSYRIEKIENYIDDVKRNMPGDHSREIESMRSEIEKLREELTKKQDRKAPEPEDVERAKEMINEINYGKLSVSGGSDKMVFPGTSNNSRSRYLGEFDAETVFRLAENLYLTTGFGYGTTFDGKHMDGEGTPMGDHSQSEFDIKALLGTARSGRPAFFEAGMKYGGSRITDNFDNVPFNIDKKQLSALLNIGVMPEGTALGAEVGAEYIIPVGSYDTGSGLGGKAEIGFYIKKMGEAGGKPLYKTSLFAFGSGKNRKIEDPLSFEGGDMAANSRSFGAGARFYFNPSLGLYVKAGQERLDTGYKEKNNFVKGGITIRGGF